MPEPQEGRVFWSARAQKFYQKGRRGAVSHFRAIETLTKSPTEATWRDQTGSFVPKRAVLEALPGTTRFIGRDRQGRPFLATEFVDIPKAASQIRGVRLPQNQQVVVRTVIVTPDGKTHVSVSSGKKGARVDLDFLNENANKKAADDMMTKGYAIPTNEVGTYTVSRTYSIRSVNIKPGR